MARIERVEEVSYRAPDGSRHGSREAAEAHAGRVEREAALARLVDILRRPLSAEERSSLPPAGPLDDGKAFHELVEENVRAWDVPAFYEALANVVALRGAEIAAAARPEESPAPEDDDVFAYGP